MGRQAGLCATVVVVASSLLWLLLVAGIVTGPAQAQRGSAESVQVVATVSPQATPTTGQPAQQGKTVENEQIPSWVTVSLLLIGCGVLLAVLGFMLWIGGLLPWHRRGRPAGWGYEVLLALLAALAAAAGLAAQVFAAFTTLPIWVPGVLLGLAVVLTLAAAVVKLRSTQLEQERSRARLVEQRVVIPGEHRLLPLVRDVGLKQLRVHAARVQVPYIERDQQDKLEEAVGPGKAVLVVGHSMSGKTRLAAEVIKRKFLEAPLVAAESGKALRELFDGGLDPVGIVVWLDELERFLGADGLTVGLLNRLTTGGAIVVATIRLAQWEIYRPRDQLRPLEWEALQQFTEVSLQRRLTGPEFGRVRAMVSDRGILSAVDRYGLAEYLGAGPEAIDKFEKGEIANPVGHALAQAAVDWRRTGLIRPISWQVLTTMLSTYLADRPDVLRTNQAVEKGLDWATAKINETVALLGQVFTDSNEPTFEAFDYLVDQLTRANVPVPDSMWALALEQAESSELVKIGLAAYQADKPTISEAAWRQAADKGDSETSPEAAFNLGVLLEEQGDLEGARAAYQRAIDSGHAEWAPRAAVNLGALLEEQGDLEGAKAIWQRAIATSHDADLVPRAAFGMGRLLARQGDMAGAKMAFRQAIDSGHAEMAPAAVLVLGRLLAQQGDAVGAKAAYQQAIGSGHARAAPEAAVSLGVLLAEQGDLEGARAAYQRAIDSGHAEMAPRATLGLGLVLARQGDLEGAKVAYQQAIDSGHARAAPEAAVSLGVLLAEQGDLEGAKVAFRRAIDSGHAEMAPRATLGLGLVLARQGDLEGAKVAYQQAIDSGHADQMPEVAFDLGVLLAEQGDVAGAKVAYQRAIDSSHAEWAPKAAVNLGLLLAQQGDLEGAKVAYQQAIDSGHADYGPRAALDLGVLLREQGDLEEAKVAFRRAIDSGHAEMAPAGALGMGIVLTQQGDVMGAKAAYQQAIDSGHAKWAPEAALGLDMLLNLSVLLEKYGGLEGILAAYQQAIDSGYLEAAPEVASALEKLFRSTPPPATS